MELIIMRTSLCALEIQKGRTYVCATMDMLRWAKSLVIQEVENYDFTVQRYLKC